MRATTNILTAATIAILLGCEGTDPPAAAANGGPNGGSDADGGGVVTSVDGGSPVGHPEGGTSDAEGGTGTRDGGPDAPSEGGPPTSWGPGLLFPNGIEPGDPAACEAPSGKRCWWVDADATKGGDGSFAMPYNSFERVAGHTENGTDYVQGLIQGGDFLYVKGIFRASAHNELDNNMRIVLGRSAQGGTPSAPTTIKSWRGSPRAVWDGEYLFNDLIGIHANPAIRIQNVEVTRANGRGMVIGESVEWAEVVSVVVHDGKGDNYDGVGGGVVFWMTDLLHRFTLRNSLIYSNLRDYPPGLGDNNVGGVGILSEPGALNGSVIDIYDNVIYDEIRAVRHKHSGPVLMRAYDNLIYDSVTGFYMRGFFNEVHHNVIINMKEAAFHSASPADSQGDVEARLSHNTVYQAGNLLMADGDHPVFQRIMHLHDNLFSSPTPCDGVLYMGRWSGEDVRTTGWTFGNNLYFYPSGSTFLYHRESGNAVTLQDIQAGLAHLGDGTSRFGDPLLQAPGQRDFRLMPSSPALGTASDGANIGAF